MKLSILATAIISGLISISCFQNKTMSEVDSKPSDRLEKIVSEKQMVRIEGGSFMGFIGKDTTRIIEVSSFYIDDSPITNAEFLEFLKKNPQWTRSNVKDLFADESYLHNWEGDFEIPKEVQLNSPVTNISWYAASAYAQSVGKRLPTVDEWEFAALADEVSKDASNKPEFTAYILNAYQNKKAYHHGIKQENPNFYGLYNMYGMVWEWTEDFNSIMISGESRNDSASNENLFCAGAAVTTTDLKNYAAFMRYAMRGSLKAKYTVNNLGFRCAKDL